jgi:hypothetical protein
MDDSSLTPPQVGASGTRRRLLAAAAGVGVVVAVAAAWPGPVGPDRDLPAFVLSAPGPGEAMAADLAPGAEGRLGWWQPTEYRFVLADGVGEPDSTSRAAAWRLVPPEDLPAAAARLAQTLGVGPLAPSEWDPAALHVQHPDGRSLWVSPQGDWYYSGPSDLWPVWDCPVADIVGPAAEIGSVDGVEPSGREPGDVEPADGGECAPPAPPQGVPSSGRARALAQELLAGLGHAEVSVSDVYADGWGASVSGELVLPDGSGLSGMFVGAGFAGDERVTWVSGTLARPVLLGQYPLVSVAGALARLEGDLNAHLTGDGGMGGGVARPMPLLADGARAGGDEPVTSLPVEPVPPLEPPQGLGGSEEVLVVTVQVGRAEVVSGVVWTDAGLVLLPHFRLFDSDGGWWDVVAVEGRFLIR